MSVPREPVIAFAGEGSGFELLADVIIDGEGGAGPREMLARYPGAAMVLIEKADDAIIIIGFRDGLVLTVWVAEPSRTGVGHSAGLAGFLYAWWCRHSPAQGGDAW